MRKTLYLHIGTFKTGTSSLQRFLHQNREWLRSRGCLVPGTKPKDHHDLALSISHGLSKSSPHRRPDDSYETLWVQFREEVEQSECPVVLLSSEFFCDFAEWHRRQDGDAISYWLGNQLDDFDVRVVCYLRPLDAYAKSWYKQLIKSRANLKRTLAEQLEWQVNRRSIHVAPTAYLDFYAGVLGAESLQLRQYERHALINGNTIDDFLGIIGLPPMQAELASGSYNPSLPDELVDAKRVFNLFVDTPEESGRIGRAMANAATSALGRPADGGQAIHKALQQEHSSLLERYGVDLGEVGEPFSSLGNSIVENRATLIMMSLFWKEIQELRDRVDDLSPEQVLADKGARSFFGRVGIRSRSRHILQRTAQAPIRHRQKRAVQKTAFERPADGGKAIQQALQHEHEALKERYGLDLGNVGDPFPETRISPSENRQTLMVTILLWHEVRALRAVVDVLTSAGKASVHKRLRQSLGLRQVYRRGLPRMRWAIRQLWFQMGQSRKQS